MSFDLVKETITTRQDFASEITQILLEDDVIVPDQKADIAAILQADTEVLITNVETMPDRIVFSGKIDVSILYLTKDSGAPVGSIKATVDFDDFLNIDGVNSDMDVDLAAELANVDYKILNDRKISIKVVMDVSANASANFDYDIVSHINDIPANQLMQKKLNLRKIVSSKKDRFIVKDEVSISGSKPNIREILQCSVSIADKEIKISGGRVLISGSLLVSTLYIGDSDESLIEFTEHSVPFNGAIETRGATEDMFGDVTLSVGDKYIQVQPNDDGEDRKLDVEVSISVRIKIYDEEQIDVLEDAYCINKTLLLECNEVKYPRLVCRNKNQTTVKETIALESDAPDILQMFRVRGKCTLDDVRIVDDKILVEGVIVGDMIFIAKDDKKPVCANGFGIPFSQTLEAKGVRPGMKIDIESTIEHTSFSLLSDREIETRFTIGLNAQVIHNETSKMVCDVELADTPRADLDKLPSMTVYVVQQGDTLWKIAKKYNTNIDEIIMLNEIETPDKTFPGQKLLILKNAVGN